MPRVNRGAIGGRLLLVGGVAHRVVELAVLIRTPRGRSKVEFADSVADTITEVVTKICRALGITGIRRRGHPDADETHSYRGCDEPNSFGASRAGADVTLRKGLPDAASRRSDGIISGPILGDVAGRKRFSPRDASAVDGLRLREIEDDPLRMQRITFAGEMFGEIRVALPESVGVAVRQSREAGVVGSVVAGETSTGQCVSIRVAQSFGGNRGASEIALAIRIAAVAAVAPLPFQIPMPRFDSELSVLAKRDWLPTRRKRHLQ